MNQTFFHRVYVIAVVSVVAHPALCSFCSLPPLPGTRPSPLIHAFSTRPRPSHKWDYSPSLSRSLGAKFSSIHVHNLWPLSVSLLAISTISNSFHRPGRGQFQTRTKCIIFHGWECQRTQWGPWEEDYRPPLFSSFEMRIRQNGWMGAIVFVYNGESPPLFRCFYFLLSFLSFKKRKMPNFLISMRPHPYESRQLEPFIF